MKLTNQQIYNYAIALIEAFKDNEQKLPIKINFYLQKNKKILLDLGKDIEDSRMEVIREYGILDEETNQYIIPSDKIEIANKELAELLELEQEVNLYPISVDSLSDDYSLTTGQMEAIMFMID